MAAHSAVPWGWGSPRGRVLARAGLGVLSYVITPGLVDEAVGDGLAWEMRVRSLPARVTAYFTLGLCLFTALPYGGVIGELTAGLQAALAAAGWSRPSSAALAAARERLGEKPAEALFRRLCSAMSPGTEPWSHVGGLLAVAWDGTTLAVRDTPANAALGRHGATRSGGDAAAWPRLRVVALVACGTRCLLDAAIGPCAGPGTGEGTMARDLVRSLRPGMLLLADRAFWGYQLWTLAAGTGCHLLWRVKQGKHLPLIRELPDGSWLARAEDPRAVAARCGKNGRRRRGSALPPDTAPARGITVRVIELTLAVTADDGTTRTEPYRLVTTLLDHAAWPAAMLAAAYARRWAIETGYLECKAYLRGSGRALRGATPALARQEAWALLAVYQAIRTLIARAAALHGTDPGRLSFTAALTAIRRTVASPRRPASHLRALDAEILAHPVPDRPGRIYPRAVKKPTAPYPSRNNARAPASQHATYAITITTPTPPASTPAHQPALPETNTPQPP